MRKLNAWIWQRCSQTPRQRYSWHDLLAAWARMLVACFCAPSSGHGQLLLHLLAWLAGHVEHKLPTVLNCRVSVEEEPVHGLFWLGEAWLAAGGLPPHAKATEQRYTHSNVRHSRRLQTAGAADSANQARQAACSDCHQNTHLMAAAGTCRVAETGSPALAHA
eukprot:352149-Chlamydomonas_euryale.AAC.2